MWYWKDIFIIVLVAYVVVVIETKFDTGVTIGFGLEF